MDARTFTTNSPIAEEDWLAEGSQGRCGESENQSDSTEHSEPLVVRVGYLQEGPECTECPAVNPLYNECDDLARLLT